MIFVTDDMLKALIVLVFGFVLGNQWVPVLLRCLSCRGTPRGCYIRSLPSTQLRQPVGTCGARTFQSVK